MKCKLGAQSLNIGIWDIAGQEDFESGGQINKALANVGCILACFAIDFPISLNNLTDKVSPIFHIFERPR